MPYGFRKPPGWERGKTVSPVPPPARMNRGPGAMRRPPPPPAPIRARAAGTATARQGVGSRATSPRQGSATLPQSTTLSSDEDVTSSAKSSETHTSSSFVEVAGSAIDSAMGEADETKEKNPNRAILVAVVVTVLLGGLTYLFIDWYRKKELRIEAADVPRLVHVVQEVQGWRKVNYISAFIMFLTGAAVMLAAVFYRRYRAEKARRHDGVFWFMSTSSILSGVLFVLYRIRARRRKALRKALEYAARHPSRLKHKIVGALLFFLVFGLLWYRRRIHALHIKKKKSHMTETMQTKKDTQEVEVMPKEHILTADQQGSLKRAVPKSQKD